MIMKRILKYILILSAGLATLASCNDYLDRLPDDRAELNSLEKVTSFLTSAYSTHSTNFIMEYSSDNVMDNGSQYTSQPDQDDLYRWQDVDVVSGNDTPKAVWDGYYYAIAVANEALAALEDLPAGPQNDGLKAEALLCRAYGMFVLANTFCMAWNPEKADEYLGLPYPKVAGQSVNERGTLRELYENINADIEAALPIVSDAHLKVPAYHFNVKAAHAFAARFNLFYHNYDKAITYADYVLGANPASIMRNVSEYTAFANSDDINNAYTRSKANLMMVTSYSVFGRAMVQGASAWMRYAHNQEMMNNETFRVKAPWCPQGNYTSCTLYEGQLLYGNATFILYPKMFEFFEVTDKVAQAGYPHIVDAVFTVDETLLVRAEAYARKGDKVAESLADVNTYLQVHCADVADDGVSTRPVFTEETLNEWMNSLLDVPAEITTAKQRGIKKPFHPQGFTLTEGTQTNLLHLILHLRRIETIYQGQRFIDIKRYGIEFSHNLEDEETIVFTAGDLRGAIQLPVDVTEAGLQTNPR